MSDVRTYEMSPFDNVLYLPNNVDVRLCPKNGMSTIKELFRRHKGHEEFVGRSYRYGNVKEFGDQLDLPFRKGSYRIAIRRDPVDRFKSACEYILQNRAEHIRQGRTFDLPEIETELESVITRMELGTLKNNHFYTQSWYLGKPEEYDMVFNINEMGKLIAFLNESCEFGFHENIHKLKVNETKLKMYNDAIAPIQMLRIKKLYAKDYINGWCKQEDYRGRV
jgi:hypothetical protein